MGVDQNRHWVCHPDRVGDLDGAAVRQTGCHHILGEVSRGISGRAIDLGRILPRERSAAVWRVATIGVHDNLAAGEAAVAVGPADDEIAGRVTRKSDGFFGIQPFGRADSTASVIISLIRPGVYFLPLRLCALCWVETTTLVQPTGLPST